MYILTIINKISLKKTLQNFELLCIRYIYYFSHNISYKTRGSHIVREIKKKKKKKKPDAWDNYSLGRIYDLMTLWPLFPKKNLVQIPLYLVTSKGKKRIRESNVKHATFFITINMTCWWWHVKFTLQITFESTNFITCILYKIHIAMNVIILFYKK